ncbi:hypothetical protein BURK2_00209 [Burkholderiales bacterium]|nr:MAG: LapA family protein [Burkholderiales bacterium]CAG0951232.1 hypothetical protein BURK2_00209 [Burkholderiales bacterium]
MRALSWAWKGALFLLLFAWSLQNLEPVTLKLFLDRHWQVPLMVLLLAAFVLGVGAGLTAGITRNVRQRRLIVELRRQLRARRRPQIPARAADAA